MGLFKRLFGKKRHVLETGVLNTLANQSEITGLLAQLRSNVSGVSVYMTEGLIIQT